jgi:membrane protein YqaA with SNARE-associated domain
LVGSAAWYVNIHAAQNDVIRDAVERGGYPMLLALSAASGFNLAVPIPIVSFFPFLMELGFHPWWALATIAFGMTLGDLVGFLLGVAGRRALEGREIKAFQGLERLRERHAKLPLVALFLYASFAPIPNEVVVIPMALLGYPIVGVGSALFAGNIIFNGLFALAGMGFFGAVT